MGHRSCEFHVSLRGSCEFYVSLRRTFVRVVYDYDGVASKRLYFLMTQNSCMALVPTTLLYEQKSHFKNSRDI